MTSEENIEIDPTKLFKIRPCHEYKEEFHECERPKGRFHQYFIFGDYLDCWQWQTDHKNCKLWERKNDINAYNAVVESEKKRIHKRLQAHYKNDVWKKRDKPPENWDGPLPEWLENENKNSYLAVKAEAIKNGTVNDIDQVIDSLICNIL